MNDGASPALPQATHPQLVVCIFPILILLGTLNSRAWLKKIYLSKKYNDVPRRRYRKYTARKARSRSRCRNTVMKSTSRTRVDDEPSSHRPSHCCRTFSYMRRVFRLRFRAAARDSNRTRVSSRGTRTRDCRWMSVEMQVIAVLLNRGGFKRWFKHSHMFQYINFLLIFPFFCIFGRLLLCHFVIFFL